MDDLSEEFFLYGSQGATTLDLVPLLAFKMLGLQVDPVFGVEGRGDGRLMFERGEANIDYQTSSAYIRSVQPMVDAGMAVPMTYLADGRQFVVIAAGGNATQEDIQLAMQEGYSTASEQVREMGFGAGMGLANIKNNSDEFNITSKVGVGTNLEIVAYL